MKIKSPLTKYYNAFSLLEMLLVLSIFIILFGITISAFTGLRSSVIMNQSSENFKQNVRWTQRAAIFLKRDPTENWIYGIGLDLRDLDNPDKKSYKVFKWCSPAQSYYDDESAQNQFPNYIPPQNLNTSGQINLANLDDDEGLCNDSGVDEIEFLGSVDQGTKGSGLINDFEIPDPLIVGTYNEAGVGFPSLVLFESINGNVFYYDDDGKILNFNRNSFEPREDVKMDFVIMLPDRSRGLKIEQSPISGKVIVSSVSEGDVVGKYSF